MTEQYTTTEHGVIHQLNPGTPPDYNIDYIKSRYDTYGINNDYISYLRFGFIMGNIPYIPNSLLDIGYGNGAFLNVCKHIIPECAGYDISGYPLPDGVVHATNPTDKYYEVITMFDVLEHLPDIYMVKKLKCKYLCISVPWCLYPNDKEWFENWKHRRPNEHIWHFNSKSLFTFMCHCGYSVIHYSYPEDIIRKSNDNNPNILTAIFEKIP